MHYLEQIIQVLFDPEYTTIALYDSPRLRESFFVFSTFAFAISLDSFLAGYLRTETLSIGLISFLVSTLAMYLLWLMLAMIFHIAADMLGGLGEFPNALGFVGLATAPLIFTSLICCVLTVVSVLAFPDDESGIIPNIRIGLTLLGMAWGAPGVFCYFGMKNAEKLHPLKAFAVTLILFVALAVLLLV
jgi:hypothetical protein